MIPDLFTWLLQAYVKELTDHPELEVLAECSVAEAQAFVKFCHKHLRGTPPVSVFMAQGLGLRLADSTEVTVLPQVPEAGMQAGWMPITNPARNPATDGISDTRSMPIFGGGK